MRTCQAVRARTSDSEFSLHTYEIGGRQNQIPPSCGFLPEERRLSRRQDAKRLIHYRASSKSALSVSLTCMKRLPLVSFISSNTFMLFTSHPSPRLLLPFCFSSSSSLLYNSFGAAGPLQSIEVAWRGRKLSAVSSPSYIHYILSFLTENRRAAFSNRSSVDYGGLDVRVWSGGLPVRAGLWTANFCAPEIEWGNRFVMDRGRGLDRPDRDLVWKFFISRTWACSSCCR